jgi:hypothetical protein
VPRSTLLYVERGNTIEPIAPISNIETETLYFFRFVKEQ